MSNINNIISILNNARTLSGNNQISYLKQFKNNMLLKEVLFYASCPDKNYKIKEKKFNKIWDSLNHKVHAESLNKELDWNNFKNNLDKLDSQKGVSDEDVLNLIHNNNMCELFKQVLFQDLRLGCDLSTFNKIWDDFYVVPQVMLAKEFDGNMPENALISRKLDGRRAYFLNGKFYSRNNKEYKTVNIQHIVDDVNNIPDIENYVLDGEFVYIDENGKEDFSKTGITARDKYTEESKNLKFAVFYAIDKNNFINKIESKLNFNEIYLKTANILNSKFTSIAINGLKGADKDNILLVSQFSTDFFNKILKESKEKGWEGLMVLDADKTYQYKRTKYLQKVKEFKDAEFKIINMMSGTGKYTNTLGYITVELPDGDPVDVGSGFTDIQRDILWDNYDKLVPGLNDDNWYYATVQYFEETINEHGDKSLRFPTFKGLRDKNGNEINIEDLK